MQYLNGSRIAVSVFTLSLLVFGTACSQQEQAGATAKQDKTPVAASVQENNQPPSAGNAASDTMILTLTPEGYFGLLGEVLSPLDLDELIKARVKENPEQKVELTPMDGASDLFAKVAARAIIGSGIRPENMVVHLREQDNGENASSSVTTPNTPAD